MPIGRFYATEELSPNIHRTPEGFLLCIDTVLNRTGVQVYAPSEVPDDIIPGPNGTVTIERDPDEVFAPDTIASFEGKPVTLEHPVENGQRVDVTSQNWKKYVVGHAQHVKRGEGLADHLTFGDLVIYDDQTIDAILKGAREISCGYDSSYEILGVGHARQSQIRGNHIAVLTGSGRCGPICSIRDEMPFLFIRRRARARNIHLYF